jgi:periplasmic divalent cation tolerance protein
MKLRGKRTASNENHGKESLPQRHRGHRGRKGDLREMLMTRAGRYRVVLVTCASIAEARRIGRGVVEKRLAACANIVARVESIYRWQGNVERAREALVMLKTTSLRLKELEQEVRRMHSYEAPEFLALPVVSGSQKYLNWLNDSVASEKKP